MLTARRQQGHIDQDTHSDVTTYTPETLTGRQMSDPTTPNANDTPQFEKPGGSNRYVLYAGLFMLAGLTVLAWIGQPEPPKIIGEALPRIDVQPMIDAQPISNESLIGKVAVIHFWGTWCPPCQMEFPEFAKLANEFADNDDVAIVSISCGRGGNESDLAALEAKTSDFLGKFDARIPTYSDAVGMTRYQISMLMESMGFPTTLVVDRDGIIVEALPGYLPGEMETLVSKIKSLL